MDERQTYQRRVVRLAESRRRDSERKRVAVAKALQDLQREDRPVTRRAVIARAGVHRNFLYRHKDLAADIDAAAGQYFSRSPRRRADRISSESLMTDLATARHHNHELVLQVQILEHRLGAQGPTPGTALLERHSMVVELRERIAELEIACGNKDRAIAALIDDVEILRETNRSLVREYGLTNP
ncbi:MAG: DUF6262 family protein [[Mycobacterium] stephanolepidis]